MGRGDVINEHQFNVDKRPPKENQDTLPLAQFRDIMKRLRPCLLC